MFTHILLEVYCGLRLGERNASTPNFSCKKDDCIPSYDCLASNCPCVTFTSCENTMCYIGEKSAAEELISFGGEMQTSNSESCSSDIDLWKELAIKKIGEAYSEYIRIKTANGSASYE